MGNADRNISVLEHISNYCHQISEMVERFGDSYESFNSDFAYRHACSMCILQIGELTAHLTDDFKQAYDDIPWRSMKGMRNVVAHTYGKMSVENAWATIKQDIPDLSTQCRSILAQYKACNQSAIEIDYESRGRR